MKQNLTLFVLSSLITLGCNGHAQVFNSGSSGALGDVLVTTNSEWLIPDNGEFHLNSLNVQPGVTLTFRKPASGLNPPVYLLSRSNIVISGTISVDGQPGVQGGEISPGGPGGFAGGSFGNSSIGKSPGDGYGPGRGVVANGTAGAFGTPGVPGATNATYGSLHFCPSSVDPAEQGAIRLQME